MSSRSLMVAGLVALPCAGIIALFSFVSAKTIEKRGPSPPPPIVGSLPVSVEAASSAIRGAFNNWSDLVAHLTQQRGQAHSFPNKFQYGSHWSRFFLFSRDDAVFPSDEQMRLASDANGLAKHYLAIRADSRRGDLYLNEPSGDHWWISEYFVDGRPANFRCSFLIHLEPDGQGNTRIEIFEYQPTIWAGKRIGLSAHGPPIPTTLHDIRPVDSTTADREQVLLMIQDAVAKQLGEEKRT
jgi:hypothetical protein